MGLGPYLAGWVLLGALLACAGGAAWFVIRARAPWMAVEARVLAWALLTAGALVAAHLIPLAVGALTRVTPLVVALALLVAASRLRPEDAAQHEEPRGTPGNAATWFGAALLAVLAIAYVVAFLRVNRASAVADVDSTSFHLPIVARLIQDGTLWHLYDYIPGWAFGEYPQSGNLLQVAVVLPWHDDFLLRALNPCFLALGALAVYAIAAELGAARPLAVSMAAAAVMTPTAAVTGLNHAAQTDVTAAAALAGGALFLLRHARTGRSIELWLAAVGMGLAFGTKWWGPPEVVALLVVWLTARVLSRHSAWRVAVRDALTVGGLALLAGGIWMVRNLILTGDPVFPGTVAPLGVTIFDGAAAQGLPYSFSVLDYATDFYLIRVGLWPQFVRSFGAPGGLAIAGAVVTALAAWRLRAGRVLAVALAALVLLVVYAASPYTAQGPEGLPDVTAGVRYALPAVFLGSAALAWLASRLGRWAVLVQVLAAAALLQAFHQDRTWGPEFKLIGLGSFAGGVFVVLVAAALTWVVLRSRPVSRPLAAAALAVGVLMAIAALRTVQRDFDKTRYRVGPVLTQLQLVPKKSLRVGLTGRLGNNLRYSATVAAFGPRLRNHVEYVGPRRDHLLVDYPDFEGFRRRLDSERYDLLLVGHQLGFGERQLRYARRARWRPVLADARFTLFVPPGSAQSAGSATG